MKRANKNSNNLHSCNFCNSCNYCDFCNSCNYCDSCNSCDFCNSCYYCGACYYSKNLKMTEHNIFCYGENSNEDGFQQPRYRAFNKEVGKDRYYEIKKLIKNDILKGLKLELKKNTWKVEWKKVSKEK